MAPIDDNSLGQFVVRRGLFTASPITEPVNLHSALVVVTPPGYRLGDYHSPIAPAAASAVSQRCNSAPETHVEWVPLEMRSGSGNLHTGPSAIRAASKIAQYEASAFMSVVRVTR